EPFFVPPVQYSPEPVPVSVAQLVAGQRARDAEPVLQGVAPVQAPAPSAPPAEPVAHAPEPVHYGAAVLADQQRRYEAAPVLYPVVPGRAPTSEEVKAVVAELSSKGHTK
ncbi:MAG: hypothetical protein SFW07_04770, partial [Gammaproteobacteria bacterium]|nr:hypothetical protein [Gammaproteobacteria bacterium]